MLYSQLYGLVATATVAGALLLQVDPGSPGHELSPLLHGLMFEDISNSGDGGGVTTLDPWTVHYGAAEISQDAEAPLTGAITSSLKITVPPGAGGFTGIANPGYRGIIVNGGYYNTTFWLRGDFQGDVKIRLLGNETDVEYGWAIIPVDSKADSWTRYEAGFWTTASADGNNLWVFEILAETLTSGSINLGYPTLFPPTFKGDELEPYVDDAVREIEFVIGDINTSGGALRASLGHPEPYQLKFVEVGNEDNLAGGCETYKQRFLQFFDAIKEAYPQITVLTSTSDRACLPDPIPEGVWLDFHDYNVPENYINAYDFYDDWDRAHPVFIGEYARWGVKWSDMRGACSEAVYMMGWERNADVIKLAAYAPTLQNYDPVNGQWTLTQSSILIRIQIPGKANVKASFTSITAGPDDANSVENPTLVSAPAVLEVLGNADGIFAIELGQFGVGVLAA
ncbi:uncharacterized protein N0V96_002893 [Colletotrichum fioriniae]|uniref:uncharacterized protein n=1 Tax=Colletotrichum fioriniae TaxID=710243 RepID=UPI0032D9AF15|nr:hypothetical protein N0V96_002893 [Colletotrichum fioriniae]